MITQILVYSCISSNILIDCNTKPNSTAWFQPILTQVFSSTCISGISVRANHTKAIREIFKELLVGITPFLRNRMVIHRLANSLVQSQTMGFLGTILETRPYGLVSKWFGLKGFF